MEIHAVERAAHADLTRRLTGGHRAGVLDLQVHQAIHDIGRARELQPAQLLRQPGSRRRTAQPGAQHRALGRGRRAHLVVHQRLEALERPIEVGGRDGARAVRLPRGPEPRRETLQDCAARDGREHGFAAWLRLEAELVAGEVLERTGEVLFERACRVRVAATRPRGAAVAVVVPPPLAQRQPLARRVGQVCRRRRAQQGVVRHDGHGRRGRLTCDGKPGFRQLLEKHRRNDDHVVFERERRDRDPLRGEPEQIAEARPGGLQAVALRRPAERAQQRLRIEDHALRRRGPLVVHEADDEHRLEPAVDGRPGVYEVRAGGARLRPERAALDPAADRRGKLVETGRRVVDLTVRARARSARPVQYGVPGTGLALCGRRGARQSATACRRRNAGQQLELRRR